MDNKEMMNKFIAEKKDELITAVSEYHDLMPNLVNMVNECVDIFEKHNLTPEDVPHSHKFISQFIRITELMDGFAKDLADD